MFRRAMIMLDLNYICNEYGTINLIKLATHTVPNSLFLTVNLIKIASNPYSSKFIF